MSWVHSNRRSIRQAVRYFRKVPMLGRHSLRPYPETRFASKDRKRAVPFHATQDCLGCVGCRRQCEHLADEGVVGTNKRSGQNGGTSAKVPLKFRCEGPEKAIDNLDDSGSFGIRSTTGRAEQAAGMLEAAQHAHQCLGGKQGVVPAHAKVSSVTVQGNQDVLGGDVGHFTEQIFLAGKMIVDGLSGDAGAFRNPVHAGAITFFHEGVGGSLDQASMAVGEGNFGWVLAHWGSLSLCSYIRLYSLVYNIRSDLALSLNAYAPSTRGRLSRKVIHDCTEKPRLQVHLLRCMRRSLRGDGAGGVQCEDQPAGGRTGRRQAGGRSGSRHRRAAHRWPGHRIARPAGGLARGAGARPGGRYSAETPVSRRQ